MIQRLGSKTMGLPQEQDVHWKRDSLSIASGFISCPLIWSFLGLRMLVDMIQNNSDGIQDEMKETRLRENRLQAVYGDG